MPTLQRYISPELTHFLGRGQTTDQQYDLLVRVLTMGLLAQPSYRSGMTPALTVDYAGSICNDDMFSPQIVCFCDIPLADLHIHMQKYSEFGIAFPKPFVVLQGGTPVFYVAMNSALPEQDSRCHYFDKMLREYRDLMDVMVRRNEPATAEWFEFQRRVVELRRFFEFGIFSFVKFFDDAVPDDAPDNYYMEREWRLLGKLEFRLDQVARVILPRGFARRFRRDVPEFFGEIAFVD